MALAEVRRLLRLAAVTIDAVAEDEPERQWGVPESKFTMETSVADALQKFMKHAVGDDIPPAG